MFYPRPIYDALPWAYVVFGLLSLFVLPGSCWSALAAALFAGAGIVVFCARASSKKRRRKHGR